MILMIASRDLRAQDPGAGTPASPAALAERSQVAQEEAQSSAAQIEDQIAKINQTLRSNGIDEAQIRGIDAALHGISDLSSKDMASVIGTLQGVNTAGTDQARQDGLLAAYKGQQAIMQKISALIVSIQIKESSDQLRLQLEDMLLRQIANRRLTTDLQKLNHPLASLSERDKGRHDIAATAQTALQANLTTVLTEIDQLAVELPPEAVDPFKQKLQALHADLLRQAALAANDAVRTGNWAVAVQGQSQLMDGLLALSELVDTSGPAAALAEAAQEGARLLDAEKGLLAEASDRADRQIDVEDHTLLASLRLQSINAAAAEKMAAANQSMDAVRTVPDPQAATSAGQEAVGFLQAALDLLKQQAQDLAQAQSLTPQQRLDQLQTLAAQVAQAAQAAQAQAQAAQQQPAAQNPAAPAQSQSSAAALAKLQQQAAPLAAEAAVALGKAAAAQAASEANPAPQPPNAQPPNAQTPNPQAPNSQAANTQAPNAQNPNAQTPRTTPDPAAAAQVAQQLAAAQAALQQQIAQAQAAAAQAGQLAQAQAALKDTNQQVAQAAKQAQTPANLPQAVNQLLAAEKTLQSAQQQQGLPDAAQQAMAQAAQSMQSALLQAAQGNQKAAQAGTQQTQQALAQAQSALAQAQAQAAAQAQGQMPGQPQSSGYGLGQGSSPPSSGESQSQTALGQANPLDTDTSHATGLLSGSGADAGSGSGLAVGKLTPQDRAAIASMQGVKTPPDFAPLVSQYYKNLTDGTAR